MNGKSYRLTAEQVRDIKSYVEAHRCARKRRVPSRYFLSTTTPIPTATRTRRPAPPLEVQQHLMRHASIKQTMEYGKFAPGRVKMLARANEKIVEMLPKMGTGN